MKLGKLVIIAMVCLLLSACTQGDQATVETAESPDVDTTAPAESPAPVQEEALRFNLDEQGRALAGFDAVAYRQLENAVAGSAEFTHEWSGAQWWFTSAENRDAFAADPERYAPAVGGFCTFGVILNKKLDGNPRVWMIHQDNLYVFLNEEVKGKFLQDVGGNLAKVGEQWPAVKDLE